MRFRFQHVPHFTETFAIDIASMNGGGRITYGADCSPNEELVEFARGTDLLIVEATLPRPERTGMRGHLTPQEAAEHACRANVKRVLLTHVSDELDELWVRSCAKRAFAGPDRRSPARAPSTKRDRRRRHRPRNDAVGATPVRIRAVGAIPAHDAESRLGTAGPAGGLPLTLPRCRRHAIHSRTSTACAVRSTSCSATSGAARAGPEPARVQPAGRRLLLRRSAEGGDQGRPRRRRPERGQPRGARPGADHQRRAPAARHRGPRLPADRDRARPVRARDPARRRRGGRRGAGHLRGRHPAGGAAAGRSARERTAGPDRVRPRTSRKRRTS